MRLPSLFLISLFIFSFSHCMQLARKFPSGLRCSLPTTTARLLSVPKLQAYTPKRSLICFMLGRRDKFHYPDSAPILKSFCKASTEFAQPTTVATKQVPDIDTNILTRDLTPQPSPVDKYRMPWTLYFARIARLNEPGQVRTETDDITCLALETTNDAQRLVNILGMPDSEICFDGYLDVQMQSEDAFDNAAFTIHKPRVLRDPKSRFMTLASDKTMIRWYRHDQK